MSKVLARARHLHWTHVRKSAQAQAASQHVVGLPAPLALPSQRHLLVLPPCLPPLQYGRAGLRWRRFRPHQLTVAAGVEAAATTAATNTTTITSVAALGVSLLLCLLNLQCMNDDHMHLGEWGLKCGVWIVEFRVWVEFGVWGSERNMQSFVKR